MAKKTTPKGPVRPPQADIVAEPEGAPEPDQVRVPGVGASAGGLEAFKSLLHQLPVDYQRLGEQPLVLDDSAIGLHLSNVLCKDCSGGLDLSLGCLNLSRSQG